MVAFPATQEQDTKSFYERGRTGVKTSSPIPVQQRALPSELAVSAQSKDWKKRPHHSPRRLTSLLLVLAALAGCAWIASVQIQNRIVGRGRVQLDRVTVTTDPVVLTSAASGRISALNAVVGTEVKAGDVLATIEVLPSNAQSGKLDIVAPVDGLVHSVAAPVNGTVASGTEFITLYQPNKMLFEAPVPYKTASNIRIGSKAKFNVPGLGDVNATVVGVRSDFKTDIEQSNVRVARMVFQPDDVNALKTVVPGMTAKGRIENSSDANAVRAVLNPKF
jgi:multidrug resistance efflux pump